MFHVKQSIARLRTVPRETILNKKEKNLSVQNYTIEPAHISIFP